jgi:oligosaccharide repeat unit polymerase
MLFLLIMIGFFISFLSVFKYQTLFNPVIFVFVPYTLLILLSKMSLFDLYITGNASSIFILFNIIIVMIASLVVSKNPAGYINKIKLQYIDEEHNIYKDFYIMRIIRWLFLILGLFAFIRVMFLVITGTIDYSFDVRMTAGSQENIIFINSIIRNIYMVGFRGFIIFDIVIQICAFANEGRKINKITIINFILYTLTLLSRIEFMRVILIFILVSLTLRLFNKFRRAKNKRNNFLIVLVFFLIIIVFFRKAEDVNLLSAALQSVIIDFTGSFIAFDQFYRLYDEGFRVIETSFIGFFAVLMHGIVRLVNILPSLLGGDITNIGGILEQYAEATIVSVSDAKRFNAFYTMFFPVLYSSGYLGSVVFSLCLGIILGLAYNIYLTSKSTYGLALYIFILHIIILGCIRWELGKINLWISLFLLIYMYVFSKKTKVN